MNAAEELQYVDSHARVDAALARVQAVQEATTPDFGIAVDFHGRVHQPRAQVLARELEPYRLMFIEEPVLAENIQALRDVKRVTTTPIALGERLYSRWQFKQVLLQRGERSARLPDGQDRLRLRRGLRADAWGLGLGVQVNEAMVRDLARTGHRWRNPVWRHANGSVAAW